MTQLALFFFLIALVEACFKENVFVVPFKEIQTQALLFTRLLARSKSLTHIIWAKRLSLVH